MATSETFIKYVCEQLKPVGNIRYKKMFGEYMVYINEKPIVIVCENTAYVKKLECIETEMKNREVGYPYKGAKEHYILDMDQMDFNKEIITKIEQITPIPKKKKK